MSRISNSWPILALTVLVLLFSATPSLSFLYEGNYWDDSDLPVTWEINQDGTADTAGEFNAVRAGYQTWENVSGSYFSETYLGTTSLSGPSYDYHNVVSWGSTEDSLATCYWWYYVGSGKMAEFDIVFDDSYTWSSTGEAGKYDVQAVATHEFGHTLSLGHSEYLEATMYYSYQPGASTLHQDDIDGIRHIYPESGNQPPNTPSSPSGPGSGMRDVSYSFSATTTDPDGDQVAFKFDWGDGTESGWSSYVGSGESASMSHSWSSKGTYQVRVKAKDAYDAESGWSAAHSIIIRIILLEVDPSSLDFGELGKGLSKIMTFRAYNAGAGTLSGSVTVNRDWIAVNPSSFEGNDNTISVTVETAGLTESLTPYIAVITIASNGGTETIQVSLLVIPSGIVAYPNPFSPSLDTVLVFWGNSVPYMKIRILNLAGELVKVLEEKYGNSMLSWDGRNEQGSLVARGIYIFVMENFSGRIAIKK